MKTLDRSRLSSQIGSVWSLEDKLRPRSGRNDAVRDLTGLGLLLGLGLVLLIPNWESVRFRYFDVVVRRVTSVYLLPAMGFLLALRCGAIDLSVWVAAGLGGLVGAWLINAGVPVWCAFLLGTGAGALLGALNGTLVVVGRIPSVIATIAAGLIVSLGVQGICQNRSVAVDETTFKNWYVSILAEEGENSSDRDSAPSAAEGISGLSDKDTEHLTFPLTQTRMILVVGVYCLVMLILLLFDKPADTRVRLSNRAILMIGLCASGALSGAGGVLWLLEYGAAPVPTRIVGDLRIVAAAVLAGGLLFTGNGRALLGGVCLPGALLLSTIWRRDVWSFQFKGYSLQVLLLIVMVLVTHRAIVRGLLKSTKARGLSLLGGVLCLLGLLVFASSAIAEVDGVRRILHWGGFIIWTIGVLSMLGHCATISAKREPGGTCR